MASDVDGWDFPTKRAGRLCWWYNYIRAKLGFGMCLTDWIHGGFAALKSKGYWGDERCREYMDTILDRFEFKVETDEYVDTYIHGEKVGRAIKHGK